MDAYICTACGTQYAPSEKPPAQCTICEEERQYVPATGQGWTTLTSLAARNFNAWCEHEPGVLGIGTQPAFAIGRGHAHSWPNTQRSTDFWAWRRFSASSQTAEQALSTTAGSTSSGSVSAVATYQAARWASERASSVWT